MKGRFQLVLFIMGVMVFCTFPACVQTSDKTPEEQDQGKKQQESEKKEGEETPPDIEAYYGTYRIREPEKRLEALRKFIGDFPESSQIESAYGQIFKLTIEIWPKDRKKMLEAAAPAEAVEDVLDRSYGYQFMAKELFTAGIFLDEAEKFASKSLDYLEKEKFIQKQEKSSEEKDLPELSDEDLNKSYRKELAAYRTTLGRIYLEQGKSSEGERILEEAYDADPTLAQAAIGLAEIAEGNGEKEAALEYLTTAALTAGYAMKDARTRLEALYRKTHGGSLDGLEAKLDARYRMLFPSPLAVERFKPTASRSGRVVLAEFFTGAG